MISYFPFAKFVAYKLFPAYFVFSHVAGMEPGSRPTYISMDSASVEWARTAPAYLAFKTTNIVKNKELSNHIIFRELGQKPQNTHSLAFQENGPDAEPIEIVLGKQFQWIQNDGIRKLRQEAAYNPKLYQDRQQQKVLNILASASKARVEKPKESNNPEKTSRLYGRVIFKDGLFWGSGSLVVYQLRHRKKLAYATFNPQTGEFFIDVLKGGHLVVELHSPNKEVIGYGETRLPQNSLNPVVLAVHEVDHGIAGVAYGHNQKDNASSAFRAHLPLANRWLLTQKNSFFDKTIQSRSSYLLKVFHPSYWPSISFSSGLASNQVRMFSKQVISSLLDFVGWDFSQGSPAILFGQVTKNARPVSGATVSLHNQEVRPIYFEGWFPDFNLNQTSSSGRFAFVGLKEGLVSVQAQMSNLAYPLQLFPVEKGSLSFAHLRNPKVKNRSIHLYDGFSGQSAQGTVYFLDSATRYQIKQPSQLLRVKTVEHNGIGVLEVESSKKASVSYIYSQKAKQLKIPLFEKEWFQNIKQRFSREDMGAAVLGFVEKETYFRVVIKKAFSEPLSRSPQIIYFDKYGKPFLPKGLEHRPFKGFVVLDLPAGHLFGVNVLFFNKNKRMDASPVLKKSIFTHLVISAPRDTQVLSL